jgi:hypothetical protein
MQTTQRQMLGDAACKGGAQRRLQRDTVTITSGLAMLAGGAGGGVLGAASVVDFGGGDPGAGAAGTVESCTTARTTAAARQAPHTQIAPIVHAAKHARARSNPPEPSIRFIDATVSTSATFRPSETKITCATGTSRRPCLIHNIHTSSG